MKKLVLLTVLILSFLVTSVSAVDTVPLNQRSQDAMSFSFAFVADTRRNDTLEDVNPIFTGILAEVSQAKPDMLVLGGDIVHSGENAGQYIAFYDYITSWSDANNIPVFAIPGNHDFDADVNAGHANWATYIGETDYYVEKGNFGFVFLNSVQHLDGISQGLTQEQLDLTQGWLANAPEYRFVFTHIPVWLTPSEGGINSGYQGYIQLADMLTSYGVIASFSGNDHLYRHAEGNGVHYITSGGGGSTLKSFDGHDPVYYEIPTRHNDYHWLLVTVDSNGNTSVEMQLYNQSREPIAIQYDFVIPSGDVPLYYRDFGAGQFLDGDYIDGGLISLGNEFTIDMTIKPYDITEKVYQRLILINDVAYFNIRYDELQFTVSDGVSSGQIYSTYGLDLVNDWTHIAATYDGSTLKIFKDNIQAMQTTSWSGNVSVSDNLYIGFNDNHPSYGAMGFHGWIKEVGIYGRALTLEEIFD